MNDDDSGVSVPPAATPPSPRAGTSRLRTAKNPARPPSARCRAGPTSARSASPARPPSPAPRARQCSAVESNLLPRSPASAQATAGRPRPAWSRPAASRTAAAPPRPGWRDASTRRWNPLQGTLKRCWRAEAWAWARASSCFLLCSSFFVVASHVLRLGIGYT